MTQSAKGSSDAHSKLVAACCEELALMGFAAWPNRTGGAKIDGRFIPFGKKGSGDILAVLPREIETSAGNILVGIHGEIECKTGEATQSKFQKAHMRAVRGSGGVYLVARSREEMRSELERLGFRPRHQPT